MKIGDNVLIVAALGIGAWALYATYQTANLTRDFGGASRDLIREPFVWTAEGLEWTAGGVKDTARGGWDRVTNLTDRVAGAGGATVKAGKDAVTYYTDDRSIWKKDDNSWLWGYGPRKR